MTETTSSSAERGESRRRGDPDQGRGLYQKFRVERTDGSTKPGGKHDGCRFFVLDLDHDEHARPAVAAYANSAREDFPQLATDLFELVRRMPEPFVADPAPRPTVDGRPDAVPPMIASEGIAAFVQFVVQEGIVSSGALARALEAAAIRFVQQQQLDGPRRGWQSIVKPAEEARR